MRRGILSAAVVALVGAGLGSASTTAQAATVYGVTTNNVLFNFDSATPGTIINGFAISGFSAQNENIVGIDFRPATGQLYALGSFGQLYTVNTTTAALTPVGSGVGPINGTIFGFDFNPTIDRIRLVSDSNKNYVINPITGALQAAATDLFYGPADPNFGVDPNVVGSAYTNNFGGAGSTQLYGIDSGLDVLVTQANSAGTLGTVGPVTANTSDLVGLDIHWTGSTNVAYASLTPAAGSVSNFYTVNLATGAAALVGQISGGLLVTDIAVAPIPEPTTASALAAAGLMLAARRRRK